MNWRGFINDVCVVGPFARTSFVVQVINECDSKTIASKQDKNNAWSVAPGSCAYALSAHAANLYIMEFDKQKLQCSGISGFLEIILYFLLIGGG